MADQSRKRFVTTRVEVEGREDIKVVELPSREPDPWGDDAKLTVVGTSVTRMDALEKVTGQAKFTADLQRAGMGTIGGNLCQRPRCWYFRRGVQCFKNGGTFCPAVDGENQYLAILDGGPCFIVHPSDPAVALTALDAELELTRSGSARRLPIHSFYVLPAERMEHETVLPHGEFVSAVILPVHAAGGRQHYHKLMQREAWDFALVSIAACRREDGDVRLVLGGVAPRPWRVTSSVEEDVSSGGLDEDTIATLADRALYDARPLSKNAYKVDLAASLLRQAIAEIA